MSRERTPVEPRRTVATTSRWRRTLRRIAVRGCVRWLKMTRRRGQRPSGPDGQVAVIGFLDTASGLGTAARGLVRALEPLRPGSICIAPLALTPRLFDPSTTADAEGDFEIGVHVYNPDIFLGLMRRYGGRLLHRGRLNMAVVNWETEVLPPTWPEVLSLYETLAAPSAFTAAAVARSTGRRVHVLPNCVPLQKCRVRKRTDHHFEFLCLFDHHSDFERKNPLAAIRAFRAACRGLPPGVSCRLRLKCHTNTPLTLVARLQAAAAGDPVEILRQTLPDVGMQQLWDETDCLVSLHRSEGFGLPVAEALARAIPVVASRQGGVLDFIDDRGGLLVSGPPAARARLASDYGEWSGWIDPDVTSAADALRRIMTHFEEESARAAVGRERIATITSPAAVRRAFVEAAGVGSGTNATASWMAAGNTTR
jgi:glycosyltransferase involved in cell wall biosynthesis